MSSLIAVLSPAKLLDEQTHYPELPCTQPVFLKEASQLVEILKKKKASDLATMMEMSAKLADENVKRFNAWHLPFDHTNSFPSILMFKGDVYRGLSAETLDKKTLVKSQEKLRILSGLYGILKPLDLAMPYRLMMGTRFAPDKKSKNLYAFWGNKITEELKKDISERGTIINLASAEYFDVVNTTLLGRKIISCEFKQQKGDKYTIANTYSKLGRGMMARFILENNIQKVGDLKAFDADRYSFNKALSTEETFVFTR